MAGFVVVAVLMRPIGGWASDRFGAIPVLHGRLGVVAVCAAISAGTPPLDGVGTVAFLVMAAALGAGSGATFALIAAVTDPSRVGGVTGLVGAAGGLGGFVPPLMMGYVYGRTESYAIGLWLLAVTAVLTLVLTRTVVRRTATTTGKEPPREHRLQSGLDGSLTRWMRPALTILVGTRVLHQGDGLRRPAHPAPSGRPQADDFYRDRWSHDKVVRSTHGVNCTGSCSWKVYVKDGIITWETQQSRLPTRSGPDSTRVRAPRLSARRRVLLVHLLAHPGPLPLHPGVLLQMYREAKSQHDGDPVKAWAHIVENPQRAKAYKSARGKGGLVRATWDEATEMVAAAHVHTIRKWGPDRVRASRRSRPCRWCRTPRAPGS